MVDLHLNSPPYLLCEIGTNFCAFQNCCETVADWVLLTEASYIWLFLHSGPLIFHTTNAPVSLVALCAGMLKIPDWRRFELKIFFMFAFCCGSVLCTIEIQRWFGDIIMLYTQNPCVTLNHKGKWTCWLRCIQAMTKISNYHFVISELCAQASVSCLLYTSSQS